MRNALFLCAATVFAHTAGALAQRAGNPSYRELAYQNGALRLEAYLYVPAGEGPFPLIVYNHGSRDGQERVEQPMAFVRRTLTQAGYAVLVPERRGYGKSDGTTFREEVGRDNGPRFLNRLRAETEDVLAAVDYVKSEPALDTSRVGIMGWSLGGIVSVFAARHSGQVLRRRRSAGASAGRAVRAPVGVREAARDIRAPILCLDADNDATTEAVKTVCETARSRGVDAELKIYPPFTPAQNPQNVAPGHLLFSGQGVSLWSKDVIAFLDAHRELKRTS
jgi:dienelactone hydrolase